MTKLKLGPIAEDKPVKITLDLPGALHRDLMPMEALGRIRPAGHRPQKAHYSDA